MIAIYADGSCLGNPGPGGAAWLILLNGQHLAEGQHSEPTDTTNNKMELRAAIDGLCALEHSHQTPCEVALRLDSKYVLDGIFSYMDNWKQRAWSKVKNPELWQELDAVLTRLRAQGFSFTNGWVKGHDPLGDPYNHNVDKRAGQASAAAKLHMDTAQKAMLDASQAAAPASTTPSDTALMAAKVLLMVARDPNTTPKDFHAQIVLMRTHLGL